MSILSYVSRRGVRDGVLGGRRFWFVAGSVVWVLRLVRRLATRRPQLVSRESLKSGDVVSIAAVERRSRVR